MYTASKSENPCNNRMLNIIIEGCCHGELDQIYNSAQQIATEKGVDIDLIIICGDFQSVRNEQDLMCLACPPKYRQMNTFYKYYTGEKEAPFLTLFVGGNHEASNYLAELPYGGWVAPNIYYMGWAGVVSFCGITIAGISGIYKQQDFNRGHYEFPPYNNSSLRSTYHVRNLEVYRLLQYQGNIDIFFSHDWPLGIHDFGNTEELLRKKRFLSKDVSRNELGSEANLALLKALKPTYYFAAHLHVKFPAIFPHPPIPAAGDNDAHETAGHPNRSSSSSLPSHGALTNTINGKRVTRFLALDKVLPNRPFLQLIQLPLPTASSSRVGGGSVGAAGLKLDLQWLSILKATNELLSVKPGFVQMPRNAVDESHLKRCQSNIEETFSQEDIVIHQSKFQRTVVAYDAARHPRIRKDLPQPPVQSNPYTEWLCDKLQITNPVFEYVRLLESGHIRIDPRSMRDLLEDTSNNSFNSSSNSSSRGGKTANAFTSFRSTAAAASDYSGAISNQSSNDPNEVFLGVSSDEEEEVGGKRGSVGDGWAAGSNISSSIFSKSSLCSPPPSVDATEILRTLNSTLDRSRADPSALDLSNRCLDVSSCVNEVSTDENTSTESTRALFAGPPFTSPPVMQSTPMNNAKVFKRRNTAMSHTPTSHT